MQHSCLRFSLFKVIDTKVGLKYLNNNHKLYIKILNNFFLRYQRIDFLTLSTQEAHDVVHTIKGLSATLGMQALFQVASHLHEGSEVHREAFVVELDRVLDELARALHLPALPHEDPKTVLILNDNTRDIDHLVDILEQRYDVLVVLNVDEAMQTVEVESIDLLLLSLDHQEQALLHQFYSKMRQEAMPMILTTAEGSRVDDTVHTVLVKSFDEADLLEKIETIL